MRTDDVVVNEQSDLIKQSSYNKHYNMRNTDANNQVAPNSLKVVIRIRPLIALESETTSIVTQTSSQSVTVQIDQQTQIQTKFDYLVGLQQNQKQLFSYFDPLVRNVITGINLTIFAYGQTGSGKTFTMFGRDWESLINHEGNQPMEKSEKKKKISQKTPITDLKLDNTDAGLIPRSAHQLFDTLAAQTHQFNIFCSFLQIYNQKIYDLLQDTPMPNNLNVHQSKLSGIFVEGLLQFQAFKHTDILELIKKGEKNRIIRQTSMNTKSSRSHTIFQILVEAVEPNEKGEYIRTKLNLCDLAGSQKINKKQDMTNEHLKQLKNINLSLTTLGKVIKMLSNDTKNLSIFRESKLTRLLQESLVGNTNTVLIGTISPSSKNRDETLNTLKFVERAKHIKLNVRTSVISNRSADFVKKLQLEMEQLKALLSEKQKRDIPKQISDRIIGLEDENKKLKEESRTKNKDIRTLLEENHEIKNKLAKLQQFSVQNRSDRSLDLNSKVKAHQKSTIPQNRNKYIIKSSRGQYANRNVQNQFLPLIGEKLNRSLSGKKQDSQGGSIRKSSDIGSAKTKAKIPLIKFETIDGRYDDKKRIMNSSEPLKKSDKMRYLRKSGERSSFKAESHLSGYSIVDQDLEYRPKRQIDFSAQIRELQKKLKHKI